MKTVIPGKAQQVQECVDFAIERCKAHGLIQNGEPVNTEVGVSIRSPMGMLGCEITIREDGNDLVIDSNAGKTLILSDPAPIPFPFRSFFEFLGDKMMLAHTNRMLKIIHSEIKHRFS